MKHLLLAAICLLFVAPRVPAQTISPVIVEYPERADGRFQIYNDADVPLTVTVEPQSFTVDSTGMATFRKLDPGLHVTLSATSFRVAPKQTYFVFYKATTETYPSWFTIYATVTGTTTPTGLKLAIQLPHTVYLTGHKTLEPSQVSWNRAEIAMVAASRRVLAEVENHGTEFARVEEVEVASSSGKKVYAGFPLFPGQRRDLELEWDQPGTPQQIVLKFPHFKTQSELKETVAAK